MLYAIVAITAFALGCWAGAWLDAPEADIDAAPSHRNFGVPSAGEASYRAYRARRDGKGRTR